MELLPINSGCVNLAVASSRLALAILPLANITFFGNAIDVKLASVVAKKHFVHLCQNRSPMLLLWILIDEEYPISFMTFRP